MINTKYCNFVKQSKAKQLLYILTNNYFKFLFQKIFFVMRCLTLCAFDSGINLVKSFLTFINFDNLFEMEFPFGYKYFKLFKEILN